MKLKEQNILFFTRTMKLGGTENIIIQLCEVFKPIVKNIVVCSCGGVNVQKLKDIGIRHYEIPDIVNKSPIVILDILRQVKKIIQKEHITVVHTHHRMAAFYTRLLFVTQHFVFLNTSHGTFYDKKHFTWFAYHKTNLVACGEMVKENLVDYFKLPDKQITVIQNAVKPFKDPIEPIKALSKLKKAGNFLIGNIGRLTRQKGMEYFFYAIPQIKKNCDMAKFVIVGEGEDKNKLIRLAEELNIQDCTIFLGYRDDVQNVMSQLDLIVLSSLWEGLPLVPIEAFSVCKTIIATAVDGTVEIVRDGKNGFLVPAKKPEAIAEKVIKLVNNPELRRSFELRAYETYEAKFSFNKFSEQYKKYYLKIQEN